MRFEALFCNFLSLEVPFFFPLLSFLAWEGGFKLMDEVNSREVGNHEALELTAGESSSSSSAAAAVTAIPWCPHRLVFCPYAPFISTDAKTQTLRVVRKALVARLTKDIVRTYQVCNPQFDYSEEFNPKRFLTSPSIGVLNDGYDNENSDLILTVNFPLVNFDTQRRYVVKDILGQGTFGQVAKCWVGELNSFAAVKIIKNQPAYYQQALVEVSILTILNKKFDPEDKHHIVRIFDYFVCQRHLCIVFELLDTNLYELIKLNHFRGLSLSIVQLFSKQILRGLALMKDAGIIHCDLKPENILLCTSTKPAEIKIIDFGSACMEDRTVYSYIQSRYYRSPEVLLGYQYTTAIDMWSFGCIIAELFLGLPLFPGASEFDLLRRMIKILGEQPPDYVLNKAKKANKFFKCVGSFSLEESNQVSTSGKSAYQALTEEEYEARDSKKLSIGKEYFNHMNLEAIVTKYPYRKNLRAEDLRKEGQIRLALIDFLRGLVEFDPAKRWSPLQASRHPFVTGEPFTCPYKPAPETPRVHVSHYAKADHHPAGGHWFAAGLSPNILCGNQIALHNNPNGQVPYGHGGSFGSLGSHGSYNDHACFGNSCGSYGDTNNMLALFSPVGPPGMNMHTQGSVPILGSSPDARRRMMQLPHGSGRGISPVGNFASLSLGTSPSQFTPPSSYSQDTSGSLGHYGPSSPARGHTQGSPLGKGASSTGQYIRRRSWGSSGILQSQETSLSAQWQGQYADGSMPSAQTEPNSPPVLGASPLHHLNSNSNTASRRQTLGVSGKATICSTSNFSGVSTPGSTVPFAHPKSSKYDNAEASYSLPDPGDWDPNYCEELLLEEDGLEMSCVAAEFSKGMHIGQTFSAADSFSGIRIFNHISPTNKNASVQRLNGPVQVFPQAEFRYPLNEMHTGIGHPITQSSHIFPHIPQISPSRIGQQSAQRFNHGRTTTLRGAEWTRMKVQAPLSNLKSGGPPPPRSNVTPWGRKSNHHISSIPPATHGRKDYGRLA